MPTPAVLPPPSAITPFYERGGIVIYLGDCRDVLPTLSKDSAALMVTDPPYGVGYRSNRRTATDAFAPILGDDNADWVPAALAQAARVMRRGRHAYIFGPAALVGAPFASPVELVWDKAALGAGDLDLPWAPAHEPITFAVYELSAANRAKGAGRGVARLRQGSVLRFQRPISGAVNRHPTEKPVPLLRRLIESSSLYGEIVLDPFLGCGSTLVAAIAEGRYGVGIELDEGYATIAAERCDRALNAMALLAPELT